MADKKTRFGKVKASGYEIGDAQIIESELEQLDGVTPGTVAVNKVIVPTTGKTVDDLNITALKIGGTLVSATAAEINAGRGAGVKVYRAVLAQTGTSAPTATVNENSLGGTLVWTRNSAGDYSATLAGAFTTATKVNVQITLSSSQHTVGYSYESANEMTVTTRLGATGDAEDAINGASIQIISYP